MADTKSLRDRLSIEVAVLKDATDVIVRNHYLHRGRAFAQIPYWVILDGVRVGVVLYANAQLSVPFRGHHPQALVELARMWIDPSVQGAVVTDSEGRSHSFPIATCAIGKTLRRIRQDYYGKYPHKPDLEACVSWADDIHHEGTIYRAANFSEEGKSGGKMPGKRLGKKRQPLHADYLHPKSTFVFRWGRALRDADKARARAEWEAMPPELQAADRRRKVAA